MEMADNPITIEETGDGVAVGVKVKPGAGKSAITCIAGGALEISVKAPPEGGKANKEVEKLVAKALGVEIGAVRITSGKKSRKKRLRITGLNSREFRSRISGAAKE